MMFYIREGVGNGIVDGVAEFGDKETKQGFQQRPDWDIVLLQ